MYRSLLSLALTILAIFIPLSLSSVSDNAAISYLANRVTEKVDDQAIPVQDIDEQLYSRQLLVYGQQAQRSLLNFHIAVHLDESNQSSKSLGAEIIKNLALSGVGRLTICGDSLTRNAMRSRQLSGYSTLKEYASSLNPRLIVSTIDRIDAVSEDVDLIVDVGRSIKENIKLNSLCRSQNMKYIASNIYGNCGFVFDDFLSDFSVSDVDGEATRRVVLKSISFSNKQSSDNLDNILRMECIDEEVLSLGLDDSAEISWLDTDQQARSCHVQVKSVINKRVLEVQLIDSDMSQQLVNDLYEGNDFVYSIEKVKGSLSISHSSLMKQLRNPDFSPCNGCLSNRQDKAVSSLLLACIKAYDSMAETINATASPSFNHSSFRSRVIGKLVGMSIKDPEAAIKQGGIGKDLIDRVTFDFWRSNQNRAACPATISVVGAITAQECIKAATGVHCPVQQFLMFESFDSLIPVDIPLNNMTSLDHEQYIRDYISSNDRDDPVACIYGSTLAKELSSLKVFVVGAGAIGCELLKTFSLLGVGQQSEDMAKSGKIIVTDMDEIEKSNLNRQLLFRERHIGQNKAIIAAETVTEINPHINVQAYTLRVHPDTENIFDDAFWNDIDVIATALDNVEARKYIDSKAVALGKWMVDSGTLGTKGNTQVIIPYLTESYASTNDPPEESIPLCTLKSFPYQPDHCIAWAKNLFDIIFTSDISIMRDVIMTYTQSKSSVVSHDSSKGSIHTDIHRNVHTDTEISVDGKTTVHTHTDSDIHADVSFDIPSDIHLAASESLENTLSTLSDYDVARLAHMIQGISSKEALISWCIQMFDQLYHKDVNKLLQEHPPGSVDEDEAPFWSGSRRLPIPFASIDVSNPIHVDFIVYLATIYARIWGMSITNDQVYLELSRQVRDSAASMNSFDKDRRESMHLIKEGCERYLRSRSIDSVMNELNNIQSESFDKDNLALGHVDFVAAASTLRGLVYSIPPLPGGRLAVQQVAGKIIPALPTSTAVVAGLVSHEIIKIASERLRQRDVMTKKPIDIDKEPRTDTESESESDIDDIQSDQPRKNKWLNMFRSSKIFSKRKATKKTKKMSQSNEESKPSIETDSMRQTLERYDIQQEFKSYQIANKERTLRRFRNSFINVARPLLTFVEPVEATVSYSFPQRDTDELLNFNCWDVLEYTIKRDQAGRKRVQDRLRHDLQDPLSTLRSITHRDIHRYVQEIFGDETRIVSLSLEDILLYADFMSNSEEEDESSNDANMNISLHDLLQRVCEDEESFDSMVSPLITKYTNQGYMDIEVVASVDEAESTQVPPIRIRLLDRNPDETIVNGVDQRTEIVGKIADDSENYEAVHVNELEDDQSEQEITIESIDDDEDDIDPNLEDEN